MKKCLRIAKVPATAEQLARIAEQFGNVEIIERSLTTADEADLAGALTRLVEETNPDCMDIVGPNEIMFDVLFRKINNGWNTNNPTWPTWQFSSGPI